MEYPGQGNKPANIWGMELTPDEFYILPDAEGGLLGPAGSGGARFSVGQSSGYQGRVGADTSNIPPSQRGLYENSAPSLEAIQSAYDANMATGRYTHQEIMDNFNAQAARDDKFWADGFAKDPNFSQTLFNESQKMLGTNQAAKQRAYENATVKNTQGVTVNDQLRASANVFDAPRQGAMPGGRSSNYSPTIVKAAAPLNPRTGRSYSSGRGW